MSLECSECERDLRGGHDPNCPRVRKLLSKEDLPEILIKKWRQQVEGSPLTGANTLAEMRDRFLALTADSDDPHIHAARDLIRETVDTIVSRIILDIRTGRQCGPV